MMKKKLHTVLFAIAGFMSYEMHSQIVINEIQYEGTDMIELKNTGNTAVDVSDYWTCSFPVYNKIDDLTVVSGTKTIPAGGLLVISGHSLGNNDELGIYTSADFGNSTAIVDYVEWTNTGHTRASVGIAAGTWTAGNAITAVDENQSIQFDGTGDTASDYFGATPTFGEENASTLSSNTINKVINVSAYPNPSTSFIEVSLEQANASLSLYSLTGQKLYSQKAVSKQQTINVQNLSNGVYFLQISHPNKQSKTIKIIKN